MSRIKLFIGFDSYSLHNIGRERETLRNSLGNFHLLPLFSAVAAATDCLTTAATVPSSSSSYRLPLPVFFSSSSPAIFHLHRVSVVRHRGNTSVFHHSSNPSAFHYRRNFPNVATPSAPSADLRPATTHRRTPPTPFLTTTAAVYIYKYILIIK
nr:hypothetical protein Iba_chr04fCG11660 [Ipomoea batatas]